MKNKLTDLNDHLFAQLERLSDEDRKGDALVEEINRAKAVTSVSREIISNASLLLDAEEKRLQAESERIRKADYAIGIDIAEQAERERIRKEEEVKAQAEVEQKAEG